MPEYYRFACAVPYCRTADITCNVQEIIKLYHQASSEGACAVLFPSQVLCGSGCGDLLNFQLMRDSMDEALETLAAETISSSTLLVCGTRYREAAVIGNGKILFSGCCSGVVFSNGRTGFSVIPDRKAFAGTEAVSGAQVMLFPYACNDTFFSIKERRVDYTSLSSRASCCCIACGSGAANSTSRGVYGGHVIAASTGRIVAENTEVSLQSKIIYTDIDPDRLSYICSRRNPDISAAREVVNVSLKSVKTPDFLKIEKSPFIPSDADERAEYAESIIRLSASALANRMIASKSEKMVLGVSGGLDSTMALISCIECCRILGFDTTAITAVSMPGFGSSERTRENSIAAAELSGAELKIIPIEDAVRQHFKDIGHDEKNTDIVFENSQARERTQILMDIANGCRGIVIGTGDLSETALGWCTYNGDQMSMYAINNSIPKTLMREVIRHYAAGCKKELAAVLTDICDTPVSPELVPGKQHTEDIIGSYELHDFFLYNFMNNGDDPEKLFQHCCTAYRNIYTPEEILRVLEIFFTRLFASQFKRSAMPEGPDVTGVNLQTWNFCIPSDANCDVWKKALKKLKEKINA